MEFPFILFKSQIILKNYLHRLHGILHILHQNNILVESLTTVENRIIFVQGPTGFMSNNDKSLKHGITLQSPRSNPGFFLSYGFFSEKLINIPVVMRIRETGYVENLYSDHKPSIRRIF
jgi:hypothetical protein